MKLIIDIPDGYDYLSYIKNGSIASANILNAVKNGTPLPEGRLIDADKLIEAIEKEQEDWWRRNNEYESGRYDAYEKSLILIDDVPTVIEGEKKDEHKTC